MQLLYASCEERPLLLIPVLHSAIQLLCLVSLRRSFVSVSRSCVGFIQCLWYIQLTSKECLQYSIRLSMFMMLFMALVFMVENYVKMPLQFVIY